MPICPAKTIPTLSGSVSVSGSGSMSGSLGPIGIYCDAWKLIHPPFPSVTMYSNGTQSASDAAARCRYTRSPVTKIAFRNDIRHGKSSKAPDVATFKLKFSTSEYYIIRNLNTFQKMSSSICPVCFEIYHKEGSRCPKLLPCTHTVCVQCLRKLLCKGQVQCPECRLHHQVPSRGVPAFATNRYVLENIELTQRKANSEGEDLNDPTHEPTKEGIYPSTAPDDTTTETRFEGVFIHTGRPHQDAQVHPEIASHWAEKRCRCSQCVKFWQWYLHSCFFAVLMGFFIYIFAHKQ